MNVQKAAMAMHVSLLTAISLRNPGLFPGEKPRPAKEKK